MNLIEFIDRFYPWDTILGVSNLFDDAFLGQNLNNTAPKILKWVPIHLVLQTAQKSKSGMLNEEF